MEPKKTSILHKLNYYKVLKLSIIPINAILISLLIFELLGKLPVFWNSMIMFYILLVFDSAFLALRLNRISEEKREKDYTVFWAKYLFILSLIIIAVNQFIQRQIVTDLTPYIIGISIASGFLTFFAGKERAEKEIEDEKEKEEQSEKKRKDEFPSKFPVINKIWGLRSIVKWMYGEGLAFSIAFIIIAMIFIDIKVLMPIIYNGSYLDEYTHIASGIEFFKT